jgi:photosystem II stability/assembly factor-like uncharacterized protein
MHRLLSCVLTATLLATSYVGGIRAASASPAHVDGSYISGLQWRMVGPFRGGRALAVSGVPGQPEHFYFGSVDGGVWESFNAGRTWVPIFDSAPIASIGAIAVAPNSPQTIYVGSGEADMRSDIAYGNGVYKSTDGGKTWAHVGLDDTRQIGAIVVDPRDANVAYVAALGHQYGPNEQRGVFKTVDGGRTWRKVLYKNADTGAIDLAIDPSAPDVLYAALWQTRRPPWNVYPPSNGPGSGVYESTDAGSTWKQLTNGLPAKLGRVGIALSRSRPSRAYALVDSDTAHGGVYRSDDGGSTWTRTDGDSRIWQRGWYFGGITVDPKNPDVVYVMNTSMYRSKDGGKTFAALKGAPGGDDYHALWISPGDPDRMILGSDQGVVVSVDGAATWSSWYNQPTGQFYHVVADDAVPYRVYGAQQDSGAAVAISRSRYAHISNWDFRPIDAGGESGSIAPDPNHPGLIYGGTVTAERIDTGWERNLDPTLAYPDAVWRNTWTLPIAFSPADPHSLYASHQKIFRSRDGGKTWAVVSPDLSRSHEGTPSNLDASTLADDNGISRHGVVYAIAPSPLRAGIVWAGTDDGYVWVTRDGAAHWQNVTPPTLTPWSKIGTIEASHFDAQTAYAAVDRHRLEDYAAHIYRTSDGGRSWRAIDDDIPDGSFANVVREDPRQRGLLYAGTEKGVYVSFDDGAHWQSLQRNLPVTSVRDIAVHGNDLAIATHGRAFWIMDDVTPLRQIAGAIASGGNYLFAPSPAYRFRPGDDQGTPLPLDEAHAANPSTGANVDYYLAGAVRTPVVIEIVDSGGVVLRHWSSAGKPETIDPNHITVVPSWITVAPLPSADPGAHRFVWNFHTKTDDGPLAPPGAYAVRMTVGGKTYTRTVRVLRDPRSPATDAELREQYDFARSIEALSERVAAARIRGQRLEREPLPAGRARELRVEIVGETPPDNPDDSIGAYSHDFTSLLYLEGALDYLESAVESGDAAPTPDMRSAYRKFATIYIKTLARLAAIRPGTSTP